MRLEDDINRHTWKWVVGGLVAVAALLWLLYTRFAGAHFDWALLHRALRDVHWGWLALSLVPIYGTYWGRAVRWMVFVRPLKPDPSFRNILTSTIIGFTAITLFGRPGEFVRPYMIAKSEKLPVSSQLAAWVLERIFDILMALIVFAFALTQVDHWVTHVGPRLGWVLGTGGKVVGAASTAMFLLILSMRHFAEPARDLLLRILRILPDRFYIKIKDFIETFVQGIESARSDSALLLLFLYTVLEWLLIAACYWCLAQAFGGMLTWGLMEVLVFMGFVSFGSVIQIPGIGGGTQVVAVLVLTELFGIRFELATIFALFTWFLTFVAVVPFGLVLGIREGLTWRGLRRIGREAEEQ